MDGKSQGRRYMEVGFVKTHFDSSNSIGIGSILLLGIEGFSFFVQ